MVYYHFTPFALSQSKYLWAVSLVGIFAIKDVIAVDYRANIYMYRQSIMISYELYYN
jgi:hypothetical protein